MAGMRRAPACARRCLAARAPLAHVATQPRTRLAHAGNEFSSEALPGALPQCQNNPRVRRCSG